MSTIALEVLIILLLLVANGVFAMAEMAVVSARKARLQQLADAGSAQARAALELATNPGQFLATVQIGITAVGVLAGAFGGATLAKEIAARLGPIPLLAPYAGTIGVGVVVLGITYGSLIIGELAPKRLALYNAERIAAAVAAPMRAMSIAAGPVVRLLSVSTDAVIRFLGVRPAAGPAVTPEEFRVLVDQGAASGVFEAAEHDMLDGVLRLDERRVGACMTRRARIVWLDIHDAPDTLRRKIADSQYARYPVADGDLENILGCVRSKDLLNQSLAGQPLDLAGLMRPAVFLPESLSALKALELLKQRKTRLALATDEYGSIQGLVTYGDILQSIAGEIPSTAGPPEPQAVRRGDGAWLLDGLLPIDRFEDLFKSATPPRDERGHYQTVGGFVMARTRSIPKIGQRFEWRGLRIEVVRMDGHRVDQVLVTPPQAKGRHTG